MIPSVPWQSQLLKAKHIRSRRNASLFADATCLSRCFSALKWNMTRTLEAAYSVYKFCFANGVVEWYRMSNSLLRSTCSTYVAILYSTPVRTILAEMASPVYNPKQNCIIHSVSVALPNLS